MALPVKTQLSYWGIAALILMAALYAIGNVLMPFILGGAMAYFLDPVADRLERWGLSRVMATCVISLIALLALIILILSIIPTLINQLNALIASTPELIQKLEGFIVSNFPSVTDSTSTIRQTLLQLGETLKARSAELANGVLSSAMGVVGTLVFILIAPVVAFYLLLDWDKMVARIDALLPRDHAPTIRRLASEVDNVLAGFVRGQVTVCLILGAFYAVALAVAGLQFGLVVGAIAGMLTFIPYVGAVFGGALAIGLALVQFWGDWLPIGIVAAIFAFGQFMEGNVLTPKLVGNSVGLHPVWLMFALSVFGVLFGFVGMLVAVPVAAVIGVLVRFAVSGYESSTLYRGHLPAEQVPSSYSLEEYGPYEVPPQELHPHQLTPAESARDILPARKP